MPRPRSQIIDLEATPYYHCINRCVRKAHLCGEDKDTGKHFDHRREWLITRLKLLSECFAIDICAYAVMTNHYHVVVKIDKDRALGWTEDEIIRRWTAVYCKGHPLVERYQLGLCSDSETIIAKEIIKKWQYRLFNISWYMRNVNEYIAKVANKEDDCTGRFWEGRFKSQALLDHEAILNCMVYVDLNPIRAGMAKDLSSSDFTSVQERLKTYVDAQHAPVVTEPASDISLDTSDTTTSTKAENEQQTIINSQPKSLLPFESIKHKDVIHFSLLDYLEVVDWTGRCVHAKKKGFIGEDIPKILQELNIDQDAWLDTSQHFEEKFTYFAGNSDGLHHHAHHHGGQWYKGAG